MKIYTKTGDKGQTGLLGGIRTSKSDLRVWAYGTIDEANSHLGYARSLIKNDELEKVILNIQRTLFEVGAQLASVGTDSFKERISEKDVVELEKSIDKYYALIPRINSFIVPGGCIQSAALDIARTKIRAAERYVVELQQSFNTVDMLQKYLNRLSDAVYIYARYEDYRNVKENVLKRVEIAVGEKISRELAEKIANWCIEKAKDINVPMAICIVDKEGHPIVFERMENSLLVSIEIAQRKAYTAAALKTATHELYNVTQPSGELYGLNNIDKIVTFGGGYPVILNGKFVGALGVSGGSVEEDMKVAEFGLKKLEEMSLDGTNE